MTQTLNPIDIARLRSGADDLQRLAAAYGVDLPAEHRHALRVTAEARRLAADAANDPIAMPTKPEKTAETVRKVAAERMLARESAAVATELAETAERTAVQIAHAAIPAVYAALESAFDKARDDFAHLVETAPLEMSADVTPERATEHVQLLGAVDRLTAAAANRLRLAGIIGEDVKAQSVLWLVMDPKPQTTLSEVRSALTAGELPGDLAGWLRIVHLGASLAHDDEASRRARRFSAATFHAGNRTPDGGRADRTYGEALALVPAEASL